MSKNKQKSCPYRRLTIAFLMLAMGNEAMHSHQASHGTRRERIEEARLRLEEVQQNGRVQRDLRGNPNPNPPENPLHRELGETRRRRAQGELTLV